MSQLSQIGKIFIDIKCKVQNTGPYLIRTIRGSIYCREREFLDSSMGFPLFYFSCMLFLMTSPFLASSCCSESSPCSIFLCSFSRVRGRWLSSEGSQTLSAVKCSNKKEREKESKIGREAWARHVKKKIHAQIESQCVI